MKGIMKKVIGYLMVATPFIAFFVFITLKYGILMALLVYGGYAFLCLFLWIALYLIFD